MILNKIFIYLALNSAFCLSLGYYIGSRIFPILDKNAISVDLYISKPNILKDTGFSQENFVIKAKTYFGTGFNKVLHGPSIKWCPGLGEKTTVIYDRGVKISERDQSVTN